MAAWNSPRRHSASSVRAVPSVVRRTPFGRELEELAAAPMLPGSATNRIRSLRFSNVALFPSVGRPHVSYTWISVQSSRDIVVCPNFNSTILNKALEQQVTLAPAVVCTTFQGDEGQAGCFCQLVGRAGNGGASFRNFGVEPDA